MDFWRAAHLLGKRKWFIILSLIVTTVLTWGAAQIVGSRWQATVRFQAKELPTLAGPGLVNSDSNTWRDPATELKAAKDRADTYKRQVESSAVLDLAKSKAPNVQWPSNGELATSIMFVAQTSKIYDLQVLDPNPRRATEMANALGQAFLDRLSESNTRDAKTVVEQVSSQFADADKNVVAARKALDQYRTQHQIIGANASQTLDAALFRLRDFRFKLEDNKQRLATAEAQLREKEAEFKGVPESLKIVTPPAQNPALRTLDDEIAIAQRALATAKKRYADSHPAIRQAQEIIDDLIARRSSEQARQKESVALQPNPAFLKMKGEIDQLRQTVAGERVQGPLITAAINNAQAEVDRYKNLDTPLNQLAQDVNQKTEQRANILLRLNNAKIAFDNANAMIPLVLTNSANANNIVNTTAGRTYRIVFLADIAALVIVCSLIIALDRIDRRVRTVKEAEFSLPTRVLAAIPQPSGAVSYSSLARATELHPQSLHSEAYRFLGLHLLNSRNPGLRSIMVLSAKAEQGSTTTVTNLGITLAQAGKRVVIVDANVRTPELHQVFQMPNDYGFTDLLANPDAETLEHALHSTSIHNLSVIPSGPQPANPWELFRSDNMKLVSQTLHQIADYVIYDTPSALLFTDALNLAPVVDAAFLCVRALEPLSGSEQRLIELLEEANVTVLGSVINHVPTAVLEGFHNYQHYYAPAGISSAPGAIGANEVAVAAPTKTFIDMPTNGNGRNGSNGNGSH